MFPIVEKLGGWDVVDPILEAKDVTTGQEAKKQWRNPERGMAFKARYVLALEARKRGIEFTENDFLWHEPRASKSNGEAAA